jgi:membrane-associated PAP2 superfamily phosphatase
MHLTAPPRSSFRWLFQAWLGLLVLTLIWDAAGWDLGLMQGLGAETGFPWRNHALLERVLHDGLRKLALLFYLALWVWALLPARWTPAGWPGFALPRRERLAVVLLVAVTLGAVNLVKYNSLTSCPWDLAIFGGKARHISHWAFGVADGGPGHCFPGGHVSSAFALLPLCLPWLMPPAGTAARSRGTGLRWLLGIVLVGAVAGVTQTVRGAHFPSHSLWTLILCSGVALAGWRMAHPWLRTKPPK